MLYVWQDSSVWRVGELHVDVHEGPQSRAGQHLSPAFLAGAVLWVVTCSREQRGCRGRLHPHGGPVQHSSLYKPAEDL